MYRPGKFRDPWRASLAVAVAGVDYANGPEDGGGSRQEILARLPDEPFQVSLDHCKYVRDGIPEDAIKIRAGGDVIGYMPKALVEEYRYARTMVAKTYRSRNRITCRLLMPAQPTRNQAYAVRQLMKDKALPRQPLWDRNAITWTLNQLAFARS